MKDFFDSSVTKRVASLFSTLYLGLVAVLAYMSLFYDIRILDKPMFLGFIVVFSLLIETIMIYSRKQFYTCFVSVLMAFCLLPVIVLNFGNWLLIIPPTVVVVSMFFINGIKEGPKTVLGVIILLFYILGALAYFILTTLFNSTTHDTIVQKVVSPTSEYRCYVVDTEDSSTGSTKIYVGPNDRDIDYMFIKFENTGYSKICYNVRGTSDNLNLEWRENDLYVNGELRFSSQEAKEMNWFSKADRKSKLDMT